MKQTVKCPICKGTGQVGLLRGGPRLLQVMYKRPMRVPVAEAQWLLKNYRGDDGGALTMLIRNLGNSVVGTICGTCAGTGVEYTLSYDEPT